MPQSPADVILCDAQAATGVGSGIIGFANEMRYANKLGVNRQGYPKKNKIRVVLSDSATGATATVAIQTSPDNSVWTTQYSFPMSIAAGGPTSQAQAKILSTTARYIRANVTALTGGSAPIVNAYMTLGTVGM